MGKQIDAARANLMMMEIQTDRNEKRNWLPIMANTLSKSHDKMANENYPVVKKVLDNNGGNKLIKTTSFTIVELKFLFNIIKILLLKLL